MNFIINFAIAVYITSTIFMLRNYFGPKRMFARKGKIFVMPFSTFIWYHFMPIVHTVKLVKIELRAREMAKERGLL